jgi:16S rRNA (cytosine967-C5)-methyltransferase
MNVSPARLASFEILSKIEREKAFSSVLLPLYEEKLALAKDRALCHELTLGVLRNQIYLDRVIDYLTKGKKLDAAVRISLRLGLYQLWRLDKIPAYSAINESVNLVQRAKKTSAKGFVNAVLRRAQSEKIEPEFIDEVDKLAVETSHPRRLIERWIKQFGFAETEKLARANNQTPPLAFRLTAKSAESGKTIGILQKLGVEMSESATVSGGWIVRKPNEMLFAYAGDGRIYFQEESSQLVAEAVNLQPGESFLDVCAAPGSKTTLLAGQSAKFKTQNLIVAGDFYESRVRFLKQSAENQGVKNLNLAVYDAENALPFADETFDVVLLDAPCTGTGTIRRNPEIRYFLAEKDFAELAAKQLAILKNASKALKRGGRLIYSTCSLEREENEQVVRKFLAQSDGFETARPGLNEKFLTSEGFARTFPQRDGTDGFFIAVLGKR